MCKCKCKCKITCNFRFALSAFASASAFDADSRPCAAWRPSRRPCVWPRVAPGWHLAGLREAYTDWLISDTADMGGVVVYRRAIACCLVPDHRARCLDRRSNSRLSTTPTQHHTAPLITHSARQEISHNTLQ